LIFYLIQVNFEVISWKIQTIYPRHWKKTDQNKTDLSTRTSEFFCPFSIKHFSIIIFNAQFSLSLQFWEYQISFSTLALYIIEYTQYKTISILFGIHIIFRWCLFFLYIIYFQLPNLIDEEFFIIIFFFSFFFFLLACLFVICCYYDNAMQHYLNFKIH
jgi:hypothetical protein